MELMRTQVLVLWRHRASFQVHHEALEHCSVTLLSLRPLRFYVANDKRSLPQSAQSWGEKEMELMRTQVLVLWRHRAWFQVSS